LDAEAVKANLERYKMLGDKAGSQIKIVANGIASVTAVDSRNVVIELAGGIGSIPYYLAVQAGMMVSPRVIGPDGAVTEPVGAGAYEVVSFTPTEQLTVKRWDGYWNRSARRAAGYEIRWVGNADARLNLVRDGQADIAYID